MFEQFVGQILRLVDDEHRFLAALDLLEEELVNDRQRIQPIQAVYRQAIFLGNRLNQFAGVHDWVQDQRRSVMVVQLLEHRAAKRRLARPDLAGHLNKALALANSVEQVVERFPVLGTVEQSQRKARGDRRNLFRGMNRGLQVNLRDKACG